jgi:hypothetical protein
MAGITFIAKNPSIGEKLMGKLQELIEQIKTLEKELYEELQKRQEEFFYKIQGRKVRFEQTVRRHHKTLATGFFAYLLQARLLNILTIPFIWVGLFPALFMDAFASFFQTICFPVYQIPKVRRREYIVIDRHSLAYLNIIEKVNCMYCSYFNGLIAYVHEIAARTEQHWCPIKHARRANSFHSRYNKFLEYGDGDNYRERFGNIRNNFKDLAEKDDD